MSIVEGFERKALFNITRAVALVCVTVFLLGIVGGVFYGVSVWQEQVNTEISPQEIVDRLKPVDPPKTEMQQPQGTQPPVAQGPAQSPLSGFQIPFSLQKYISGDNAQIVRTHLNEIPAEERQAYLNELGAVVTAAEANKINAVEAINAYMEAKSERYKQAAVKRAEKWETLKVVAEITASGLFLVAIFSLVLVLLAIERNTRSLRRSSGLPMKSQEQEVIGA
ncbi:hypothetical protein [Paraburkholderia sp. BL17N1]|uniref:hypothetical protein n=1 Tax=Paraburkholderia sp. BL17N1 TaxID=1938798 RepID=UPI000EB33B07|nr:hypothetical protein [Paraburkholderia sp. BL17N1]RKR36204.1 hypothetical protein B0G82_4238 [Paraburkholderia sp. BL17N1]